MTKSLFLSSERLGASDFKHHFHAAAETGVSHVPAGDASEQAKATTWRFLHCAWAWVFQKHP